MWSLRVAPDQRDFMFVSSEKVCELIIETSSQPDGYDPEDTNAYQQIPL